MNFSHSDWEYKMFSALSEHEELFSLMPGIFFSSLSELYPKCDQKLERTALHISMSSSVQFSHSVVSDSLQPYELQHARPPCPSPTPGVHPNPYPLSQ